jgi:hypothetical protein
VGDANLRVHQKVGFYPVFKNILKKLMMGLFSTTVKILRILPCFLR